MEKYKTLIEINKKLVFGEEISEAEKRDFVLVFLSGICAKDENLRYKKRMGVNGETDKMYPGFYLEKNENLFSLVGKKITICKRENFRIKW